MNLRQKNKKLKQKLEWYQKNCDISKPVELYSYKEYEIRTVVAERVFDNQVATCLSEEELKDLLTRDLHVCIREFIQLSGPFQYSGYADACSYRGELTVAIPKTST